MILTFSYEELRALAKGADMLVARSDRSSPGPVIPAAEAISQIERLRPRLASPLSIDTLAEQKTLRGAVALICDELHEEMEAKVIETHPAHEDAVALYFDYAHAFSVLSRLDEIGSAMTSMIELMTGAPPTASSATNWTFPDE